MPSNIRSGDGAGAGMGFRGGKGKPGYPVPDIIKNREEPTETGILDIVEDVISQVTAVPGMVQKTTWDIADENDPLDLVVRDVIGGLVQRESKEKGEDLGFGFNEDGFPIQDEYEFQGLPVSVENKRGSTRKWYDKDGKEKGSTEMYSDYGYIDGYIGADGEPVDVYVGPTEDAEYAYVVHQNKAPDFENYDEDKVMLGFPSEEAARESYKRQYNDERFYGGMSSMPMEKFKAKLKKGGKITNESVRWTQPDMSKESGELDRVASEEGLSKEKLLMAAKSAKLSPLSDDEWSRLENTDSWSTDSRSAVRKLAAGYGKEPENILAGIKRGGSLPAPIILVRADGTETCVAGNTRLMAAKALKARPSVLRLQLEAREAPKMIAHLDDLKPAEFLQFLQKYRDMPIKGGLEISEKVDGSAQMSFGAKGGNLWTKSKHGQVKTRADQYGDQAMSLPLRMAHTALEPVAKFMPDGVVFVSDVLYSRIPNSIEYGENRIVVHGVHAGGKDLNELQCKRAVGEMAKLAGDVSDGKEGWRLEYKRTLDPKDVMVDTEAEYKSLGEIYEDLQGLEPDRLKAAGKAPYKATLERFQTIQKALKKKLVDQLRKQSSAYGPEGGDVEGLVFKDLETGSMTKLVDKEYFTKLNKFLWNYRELLDKGVKVGDRWEFGVLQKFRNSVADNVMGSPASKAPNFVNKLRDFGADLEYPPEADTSEKKSDYLLSQYVQENDLMQGDFIANFKRELESVQKDFDKLKADWDEKKKGDLVFNMKDDAGKTVKSVKMDPLIKARTDDSFNGMEHFLTGASEALVTIGGMKGDLTKRTALLKLMLGQTRLEKLKTPTGEPVQESVLLEVEAEVSGKINRIVTNFEGKLAKKGIKIGAKLGEGANGIAYDIGGGKVLKVTEDPDEAAASNHLKGKNIEGVAHFYDVFRFPSHDEFYGIVLEKLEKLSPQVQMALDAAIEFLDKHSFGWEAEWEKAKQFLSKTSKSEQAKKAIDTIEFYGIDEILDTLKKHQVDWMDVHTGNLMMRKGKVVAFDLGTSDSPGKAPPTLERKIVEGVIRTLGEARADKVGVTIGRFQPFHKGHAAVIRDLTKRFNKVIVLIAGNTKDAKNPFSYETRLEMMQKSLPDCMSKIEVYKATYGGKNSGYVPGVLSDISKNTDSSVAGDTAVTVLVGEDRLADIQKQMAHAEKSEEELSFDPSLAVVEALPDVKNDDDADRVSGTRVREAVVQGNEDVVRSMMDPHLVSNPGDFEKIYAEMKQEIGADKAPPVAEAILEGILDEVIADIGGEKGVMEILQLNKDRLENSKWHIQVDNLKRLGMGAEGIAFDIGSNRVLKVTADEAEAKTSYGLLGKTSPHVVHIFDVFGFPALASNVADTRASTTAGQGGKHPAYGVVTEKLTPLNDAEGKEFDDATDWLVGGARTAGGTEVGDIPPDVKTKVQPLIRTGKWDQAMEALGQILKDDSMKEVGSTDPNNPRVMRVAQRRFLDLKNTFDKFKLPEIVKELAALHIEFSDFHSGNLMKRGADYVINDLGRSESPSNKVPPKLGEVVSRIMEQLVLEFDMGTGMGSSTCSVRGGSSAVSSFKNPVDPNSKDQWQTQLSRLEIFGSGALPEGTDVFAQRVVEHQKNVPVFQMEQWIPLSELSVPFLEHKPHTNAGRGETAFAIEQHLRGHHSKVTGLNNSYDNESDMKYEVKEFGQGGVRIEKTAIPSTGAMLSYMAKLVSALSIGVGEIENERKSSEDWLAPFGMTVPELKSLLTASYMAISQGNLSRGLMGMTTQRVLENNFKRMAETIHSMLKKNSGWSKNSWSTYGQKEIYDGPLSPSKARLMAMVLGKKDNLGEIMEMIMDECPGIMPESVIIESRLDSVGISPDDLAYESLQKKYLEAFDPAKIMGEVQSVVMVDCASKQFFAFPVGKMLEYLQPNGVSKGVPSFKPTQKLRGPKKKRASKKKV